MLSLSTHSVLVRERIVQSGFVNKFNRLIETITLKRTIRLGIASLLHAREWTKEKQAFKSMTCQVLQVQVEQAAFYCNYYYYGSTSLVSHSAKPEHRTTEVNPSCDVRLQLELTVLHEALVHYTTANDKLIIYHLYWPYLHAIISLTILSRKYYTLSPPPGFKRSVRNLNNRLETHAQKDAPGVKKRQFTRLCILYDLYTILRRSAQYIWFVHQAKTQIYAL